MSERFPKKEILKRKKYISVLFNSGKYLARKIVGVKYLVLQEFTGVPVQVMIIVPKKKIRKSSTRNLIKRRMREAYRKNKPRISLKKYTLAIALIYKSDTLSPYREIEKEIVSLMHQLEKIINGQDNKNHHAHDSNNKKNTSLDK